MKSLKNRLAEVMTAMEWQHMDLVKISGQSSSVVSQWLGNGSKEIKSIGKMEAAERIEQASGFSALWVAKGLGPKHVDGIKKSHNAGGSKPGVAHSVSLSDVTLPPLRISWGELMSVDLPQCFQVEVPDDAVAPLVPAGSTVTFDRSITEPRPGDGILVRDAAGGYYFRRYRAGRPGQWEAYSSNDAYRLLDSERDGLQLIGVFVGSSHRLG